MYWLVADSGSPVARTCSSQTRPVARPSFPPRQHPPPALPPPAHPHSAGLARTGSSPSAPQVAVSLCTSKLRWPRRSRSFDALLPVLYLCGVSSGDFQEAGADGPNLPPGAISRLTASWQEDYDHWQHRDHSERRYVYIWADRLYLQSRMEPSYG